MDKDLADILPDIEIDQRSQESSSYSILTSTSIKCPRHNLPSKCEICGNPAIGYHYDIASCNGCKAFFRRTVITGRQVACKKWGTCLEEEIPINRRICPGCRFSKCVKVGMNPRAIRAEISSNGEILKNQLLKNREADKLVMLSVKI